MAVTFHLCWTEWHLVMSWSPCRLKVEELEGERSRLEQEKQALEMQMERLTLQVGLGWPERRFLHRRYSFQLP